ncbi:hypothetical protein K438DRAFT_1966000 [Mycena galopus ATCC 62051]|nr:hypothetical protein K438DRAFT_1966000 [Mycena galopus ATCC 62051]
MHPTVARYVRPLQPGIAQPRAPCQAHPVSPVDAFACPPCVAHAPGPRHCCADLCVVPRSMLGAHAAPIESPERPHCVALLSAVTLYLHLPCTAAPLLLHCVAPHPSCPPLPRCGALRPPSPLAFVVSSHSLCPISSDDHRPTPRLPSQHALAGDC